MKSNLTQYVFVAALALSGTARAEVFQVFNTGVDGSGAVLPDGTLGDPHYKLTSVPGGSTQVMIRTQVGGFPIGPWIGDNSTSAWTGPNNQQDLSGLPGSYTYETTFDLTGFDATTALLAGRWSTDNSGTDILLNGHSMGQTAAGFTSWSAFSLDATGNALGFFNAGLNTLDFIVSNAPGPDDNPTGLRVEFDSSTAAATPEPSTWALAGMALLALARMIRRPAPCGLSR